MALDDVLNLLHRNILELTFFDDNDNISFDYITYLSNLYISGSAIINDSINIDSNLYINSDILLNIGEINNINIVNDSFSNLLTTNNINSTNILINNLNNNDTLIYHTSTLLSTLNAVNINTSNILTNLITSNSIIISGNIINIGTINSRINIYDQFIGISTTDLVIDDNILELNINISTLSAADNGNQSGFEILGTGGNNGFIKTDIMASNFQIKSPKNPLAEYILSVDTNDNLNILGMTNIHKNVTINSSLFVSNILNSNNVSINSILYSNNDIITFNNSTFNSTLNVNNILCYNTISLLNSNLTVNKDSIFYNTCTIFSNINILNNCIINKNVTINSQLYVNNDINFNNNTYINNDLNIRNNLYFNNNLTVSSNLYVNNNCNIINTLTINSKLYVHKIINNDTHINSNLNILGNATLLYKNTLTTILNNISLLGNVTLTDNILDFNTDLLAETAGMVCGQIYRTGGILRIRVNSVKPTMTLIGSDKINIRKNNTYSDLGVISTSFYGNNLISYIISIGSNILSTKIDVSSPPISIPMTSSLAAGVYIITYNSIDSDGNEQFITRKLEITINLIPPTMILIGADNINLPRRINYSDLGVTSTSYYGSSLTTYIISIGSNILPLGTPISTTILLTSSLALGTYIITYNATDSVGNTQSITRTLNIVINSILPTMRLVGAASINMKKNNTYSDFGITSTSYYGDILTTYIISVGSNILSPKILVSTTTTTPIPMTSSLAAGVYIITYNSTDSDTNLQTITRTLEITLELIPPTMSLIGATSINMKKNNIYSDLGINSVSYYGDILTSYIISIGSNILSPKQLVTTPITMTSSLAAGIYTITYNSTDSANIVQTITRRLEITLELIPPTMTLLGPASINIKKNNTYSDIGVTSTSYYGVALQSYIISIGSNIFSPKIPVSTITTTPILMTSSLETGIYIITYNSTDSSNTVQTITRTLEITLELIPPTMTLIGATSININKRNTYSDPGVTSTSHHGDILTTYIISIGSNILSPKVPLSTTSSTPISMTSLLEAGSYIITYNSTDSADIVQSITRTLEITIDLTPPTMTLVGADTIEMNPGSIYSELGVTSTSHYGAPLVAYIISIGSNILSIAAVTTTPTNIPMTSSLALGTYIITYNATDNNGNVKSITRTLVVTVVVPLYNAFIISTAGPNNVYNSETSKYEPIITWNTGINTSNIVWSFTQGNRATIFNPYIVAPNNSWYFPSGGQSFCFPKTFLSNIDIVNASWYVVFKMKNTNVDNTGGWEIGIDSTTNTWYNQSNVNSGLNMAGQDGMSSSRILIRTTEFQFLPGNEMPYYSTAYHVIGGSLIPTGKSTSNSGGIITLKSSFSALTSGIFLKIYKSSLTTMGIQIYNAAGSLLISFERQNIAIYFNQLPFHIYQNDDQYKFYDGFLYSKTDILASSFSTAFPSGNTFS